jgi:hypothetical protein
MNGLVVTPLLQSRDNDNVLTLSRPVTVPARSEAFLPVATSENYGSQLSLIEAWPAKCDKTLLVAKALVRPNRHETFCRVANLTSRPKRLRRGTPIAMISPINAQDSENVRLLCDESYRHVLFSFFLSYRFVELRCLLVLPHDRCKQWI